MESLQERADGSRVFGQTVLRETGGAWVKLEEIFHILAGLERLPHPSVPLLEVAAVSLLCPHVLSPALSVHLCYCLYSVPLTQP